MLGTSLRATFWHHFVRSCPRPIRQDMGPSGAVFSLICGVGADVSNMARILVMDDEETVRDILRQALEGDGHEVEEAVDDLTN